MTTCTRGSCDSQCDNCHTLNNCVPSVTRVGDLLLCASCAAARNAHPTTIVIYYTIAQMTCVTPGCGAVMDPSLIDLPDDGGGLYTGWTFPHPENEREDCIVHEHKLPEGTDL